VTTAYYWSGFLLNNLMDHLVVFSVACTTASYFYPKIVFETVIVNEGNAWNMLNSQFVAPHTGIYVFSVSVGFILPYTKGSDVFSAVLLVINTSLNETQKFPVGQASGIRHLQRSNNTLTRPMSCSLLVDLPHKATVEVWLSDNIILHNMHDSLQTSVSAFYYSPISKMQVVLTKIAFYFLGLYVSGLKTDDSFA
jgi:hypothetical protein